MKRFRLHYYIQNNGDGSASMIECPSEAEAEGSPGAEEEWGESTASYQEIILKDGKLFYEDKNWNPKNKSFDVKLIPLEEV